MALEKGFLYETKRDYILVGIGVSLLLTNDPERVFVFIQNKTIDTVKVGIGNTGEHLSAIELYGFGDAISFDYESDFGITTQQFEISSLVATGAITLLIARQIPII
jgi:hypothetical protein